MGKGTLYLVPSALSAGAALSQLAPSTLHTLHRLRYLIAEDPKCARAFLKAVDHPEPIQDLRIETLDEHTPLSRLPELLQPLETGTDCGLVSDAGCPAVADPGAALVRAAHDRHLTVAPLVGPSALLLALMACGMNGQRFSFHGYLPVETAARAARIVELERESEHKRCTQIFIEAPYRNESLLDALLATCKPETLLCLAVDLTAETQTIRTQSIAGWRRERPPLARRPTVFLLYAEGGLGSHERAGRCAARLTTQRRRSARTGRMR